MQSARQWRLSSAILAAVLFFALGMGMSASPAWALDDESAQPQEASLTSTDEGAGNAESASAPAQQDISPAVEPADAIVVDAPDVAGSFDTIDPSEGVGYLDSPDVSAGSGGYDEDGFADDSAIVDDYDLSAFDEEATEVDTEGSSDGASVEDGVEGESPPSADDASQGDDPDGGSSLDGVDAEESSEGETPSLEDGADQVDDPEAGTVEGDEEAAEGGEEAAIPGEPSDETGALASDDNAITDGDSEASEEDASSDAEDAFEPEAEPEAAPAASAQGSKSDQKVDAEGEKAGTTEEAAKEAKRVLPSANKILKARNRVIWALLNGKKTINLKGFGLKFSRKHDFDEVRWYIEENALGYLGYTVSCSYDYSIKNNLYVLTELSFSNVKKPTQAMRDALDDMMSWVPDSAKTVDKVKAVHDWLVRHCSYNDTGASLGRSEFMSRYGYDPYHAESALVQGRPVCQGYASAFMLAMARLGVPCEMVGSDDHAWNRVKINGDWYNVDVTWDDSRSSNIYFMKSDYYFLYTRGHDDSNTSDIIRRPGTDDTYDYTSWKAYRGSTWHGYVWDYKIAHRAYRMGTNALKRLTLQVTDGSGIIPCQTVRWSSANKKIAVVTPDGYVISHNTHGKVKLICSVNGVKRSCTVWVVGGPVNSKNVKRSLSASAFWYDGKKHVPVVTVRERTTNGTLTLRKGTDYTITYLNAKGNKISASQAKKRGTYYVLIKGKGIYSGKAKLKFQITKPTIAYKAHVQNIGWQTYRRNGKTAGTSGQSLRVEALKIQFAGKHSTKGSVVYRTHVQNKGWETKWRRNGQTTGTTGKSLRLEAIQIKLTGDMAKKFNVYYRTHVQNKGWMGWAKNGQKAGSAGYGYRMEAVQVILVRKGAKAPTNTRNAYAWRRR